MPRTATNLTCLLALTAGGHLALAQQATGPATPGNTPATIQTQPDRSGPQRSPNSASARPVRAVPANPAPVRPSATFTNPANAQRAVFVPVAPNTRDSSSVSTSLRGEPIDLRVPLRFDRVFALRNIAPTNMRGGTLFNFGGGNIASSSAPLDAAGTEWFARIDGGLIALFPRSSYVETNRGTYAEIPAGTIFALGHPPANMFGLESPAPTTRDTGPTDASDTRPTARGADRAAQRAAPASLISTDKQQEQGDVPARTSPRDRPNTADEPSPSILNDDDYRSRRVRGLLLKAASVRTDERQLPVPPAR